MLRDKENSKKENGEKEGSEKEKVVSLPTAVPFTQRWEQKRENFMASYKCTVCGYIYDPAKGDPDNGVKPGTAFEALPDGWVCPECGVGKDMFEKL